MIRHHSADNHNYNKQTTTEATEHWGWLLQIASVVVSVVVADVNIVAGLSVDDGAAVVRAFPHSLLLNSLQLVAER